MAENLTPEQLAQAAVALDILFTNEDLGEQLENALSDESGLTLSLYTILGIEGADSWSQEATGEAIGALVEHQFKNAEHYIGKFFDYGGTEKSLAVRVRELIGASERLRKAFTLPECLELVRHLRDGDELTLSGVDRLTGVYLLNKTLTPEFFEG